MLCPTGVQWKVVVCGQIFSRLVWKDDIKGKLFGPLLDNFVQHSKTIIPQQSQRDVLEAESPVDEGKSYVVKKTRGVQIIFRKKAIESMRTDMLHCEYAQKKPSTMIPNADVRVFHSSRIAISSNL